MPRKRESVGSSPTGGDDADPAAGKRRRLLLLTGIDKELEAFYKEAALAAGCELLPAEEGAEDGSGIASETEYSECDLSSCPEDVSIRNSGHSRIDGLYKRLARPSRGRPCYSMQGQGSESLFLFWYKTGSWHLSHTLGSRASLARVGDAQASAASASQKAPPCEPHPFPWEVAQCPRGVEEKASFEQAFAPSVSMRVIDIARQADAAEGDLLSMELDLDLGRAGAKRSETTKKHGAAAAVGGVARQRGARKSKGSSNAASAAIQQALDNCDGPLFDSGNEKEEDEGEDGEDDEGEGNEGEGEDKENGASPSLPSSAGAVAGAPRLPSATPLAALPTTTTTTPPPPTALLDMSTRAPNAKGMAFAQKLREQLEQIPEPARRLVKFSQVLSTLNMANRRDQLKTQLNMTNEGVEDFLTALRQDFGSSLFAIGGDGQQDEVGVAIAASAPRRSCLKRIRRRGPFGGGPRISWNEEAPESLVPVESFRHMADQLWFQMPGAYVMCDGCDKQVPQSMGALQGEPLRGQFAQSIFLCIECLQTDIGLEM